MRIGIDCRLWNETGVGRYTRNLVRQLQKLDKKNEYVLFVFKKDEDAVKKRQLGINWKLIIADIRWHSVAEQLMFPSILNKEQLDLVHFPYFSVPIFYNRPFVVTIHDLIIHHFPTGEASTLATPIYQAKLLAYKFILSHEVKKAKKIITVSRATKQEIINHLSVDPEKIVVTYEGVEDFLGVQDLTIKAEKGRYFLYVGNAYPHKNLDVLISAFSQLKNEESMKDIKLILVGKEDYFYERIKKQIKLRNLEDSVIIKGQIPDEVLVNLYKNAIALVMPSKMEGFGLPVLEAMSNSCLVIASNIKAVREIADDAAVYFNSLSEEDMAEKMKVVCINDLKHFRTNIQAGLERAAMFSWEKMTRQTIAIYESCFSVRPGK